MSEPIGEKDKITILLHEYDTLRQEIVNRMNNGFQLLAVCAVLLTLLFQAKSTVMIVVGICVLIAVIVFGLWTTFGNINNAAARLRELEADTNTRAGEKLLIWESECAGALTGWWRRIGLRPRFKASIDVNKNDFPVEPLVDQQSKEK